MSGFNLIGFSLNNFRIFDKQTSFDLAPLTILTGTNSSGKSSLTKALKLLARSHRLNGLRSLALMESDLKLGDYKSIKNSSNGGEELFFSLDVALGEFSLEKHRYKIDLIYNLGGLKSIKLYRGADLLMEQVGQFSKPLRITKSFLNISESIINTTELDKLFIGLPEHEYEQIKYAILDYLKTSLEAHSYKEGYYEYLDFKQIDVLEESYTRIEDGINAIGKTRTWQQEYFDPYLNEAGTHEECQVYSSNPQLKDILPPSVLEICNESIKEEYLSKYLLQLSVDKLYLFPLNILKDIFSNMEFIDGVRATQEIIYTKDNSPGFYEIIDAYYASNSFDNSLLKQWVVDEFKLLKLKDAEEFEDIFEIIQIPGYGYMIRIMQSGLDVGLSGLGYGASQLLPILLKVSLKRMATFIIEEPESNLHPALQSKLADFFVSLNNLPDLLKPRFVIETHSEYLIRKLQYLTAKGSIDSGEIQLYYFNHPDSLLDDEDQVKKINFTKSGSLTENFGRGFFDEADNIALELFLINQSQNN